jgi:tRNA 2-thiouridine synthesizing protein A
VDTQERRLTEEPTVDLTENMEGLVCPLPVVRLAKAIKRVEVGGVIEGLATDPGVPHDIRAWCRTTGNELVSMDSQEDLIRFLVRRQK